MRNAVTGKPNHRPLKKKPVNYSDTCHGIVFMYKDVYHGHALPSSVQQIFYAHVGVSSFIDDAIDYAHLF